MDVSELRALPGADEARQRASFAAMEPAIDPPSMRRALDEALSARG